MTYLRTTCKVIFSTNITLLSWEGGGGGEAFSPNPKYSENINIKNLTYLGHTG